MSAVPLVCTGFNVIIENWKSYRSIMPCLESAQFNNKIFPSLDINPGRPYGNSGGGPYHTYKNRSLSMCKNAKSYQ